PDFSYVGYAGANSPIPDVPVVTTLRPVEGDNSIQIQQAIDSLAEWPLGADGFRGALLLKQGIYEIRKGLIIRESGIVLRGEGQGTDGTVLRLAGGSGFTIFSIGNGSSLSEAPGTRHNLVDSYVPVGARW